MSSYSVKLENDSHAIKETIEYLGNDRFDSVVVMLRKDKAMRLTEKMRCIHFVFGMLGVSGYALHHALFRYVYLKG